MISISKHKLDYTTNLYRLEIDNHISAVKKKIWIWLNNNCQNPKSKYPCLDNKQDTYLRFLYLHLAKIVYCDMSKLEDYMVIFNDIIPKSYRKSKKYKPFKNKLIDIMGYTRLRSYNKNSKIKPIYPQFFRDLGIKACVYCNSQLTITTVKNNTKYVGRFQVDHYVDKASYPCFSISFVNLYPVCSSCNNKKGGKDINFELYFDDSIKVLKSDFKFSIDRSSIADYRLTKDDSSLKIFFDDNDSKLNELFAVKEIYETQKDLAAEIIAKSEIYNESYKTVLQNSFSKLYGKGKQSINFNRIILGNYTEPKDIHKRPMSKFTQDIAKQLKLL